ncbi:fatty acid desaturase [Thioploca ingrica]|uniref:Fatty acid desaturase n=1 Tax=Thioploca ingrica TaxID=40754 RepID=A0A090AQZ1_9GAMM|nr:fatty acid desaturase [Thioploca ingrica]
MLNGLLELPVWGVVVVTLIMTHITIASVTIFLHRHQAHRALELHPITSHFFRFWIWLTTSTITKEWVAVHRKHHANCETPNDPHSPQIFGIKKVLWQGAELYAQAAHQPEILAKYGHGTPNDWLEQKVYTGHAWLGITIMAVIDLLLFGVLGITVWAVQMMWIPIFAAGFINGLGHWWGYRNYECADASKNIVPWGIFIGGEELHNNHHTFASSAKLSSQWWEIDIGWLYIRLLQLIGLVKVKKVATHPRLHQEKNWIDRDTVKAILHYRFQVMAHYAKEVLVKVYKEELRHTQGTSRQLLKRVRALLIREESLLNEQDKINLVTILEQNQTLQTVYHYRMRLQALWQQTAVNQEYLLQSLQEWCKQAEATGIKALQEFALTLRHYTMQPV